MVRVEPRQALLVHLRADPGVQREVGGRVYSRRVPTGATKPLLLIYPPISDVPVRDLDGVAYRRTRLQVTAFATDIKEGESAQPQAERAIRAVVDAVEGFSGQMAGALHVILATAEAEEQVDQEGVDEIRHHVDVVIKYKR